MRKNPMFLQCCDKCAMPRSECVCIINIKVTPKKSISELFSKEKIKEVIDMMLSIVDWESDETFAWIDAIRKAVFKRYGREYLEYLDNQIATLGGRRWGRSTEQPQPVKSKK